MSARTAVATRLRTEQSGLTLMELLIAAGLLGMVITVVGSILVSLVTTERTVSGVAGGTTSAQLAATAIDARISQSSSFQVTDVGADQLLVARVAGRASTLAWECHAWYFSAAGTGSIRHTIAPDGTVIPVPAPATLQSWPSLITGVAAPASEPVFTKNGDRLTIAFDAATGDSPPVAIRLTSVGLTGVTEEATCS